MITKPQVGLGAQLGTSVLIEKVSCQPRTTSEGSLVPMPATSGQSSDQSATADSIILNLSECQHHSFHNCFSSCTLDPTHSAAGFLEFITGPAAEARRAERRKELVLPLH